MREKEVVSGEKKKKSLQLLLGECIVVDIDIDDDEKPLKKR